MAGPKYAFSRLIIRYNKIKHKHIRQPLILTDKKRRNLAIVDVKMRKPTVTVLSSTS